MPKITRTKQHELLAGEEASAAERRAAGVVDAAIRAGEAAGEFAHLPGRGKPLAFRPEEGLATLDENWLANHILKNAAYLPPWVQLGHALEAARALSRAAVEAWRAAPGDAGRRQAVDAAWRAENTLIARWNAQVPSAGLQRYPMPLERRWARLSAAGREGGSAP